MSPRTTSQRFRCPACGFAVFNRRLTRCESCQAALPDSMRYSAEDLARVEADAQRIERWRAEKAREAAEEAERRERSSGG